MAAKIENPTEIRKKLFENGYIPLPNLDKQCVLKGWPTVELSAALIEYWGRMGKFTATGIRIDRGLMFLDVDIAIQAVILEVLERWSQFLPEAFDLDEAKVLERGTTASCKVGFFLRAATPFGRMATHNFEDDQGGFHKVEIWGGASGRQAGAFGPHSLAKGSHYVWHYDSPLEVPVADLVALTVSQCDALLGIAEEVMRKHGLQQVAHKEGHDAEGDTVWDLTPEMEFESAEGVYSLDELKDVLGHIDSLRITGSWHDRSSDNVDNPRCIARLDTRGELVITDFGDDNRKHREASEKPLDEDEFVRVFSALPQPDPVEPAPEAAPEDPPVGGDNVVGTAEAVKGKLLQLYCYNQNSRNTPVVSLINPEAVTSMRNFTESMAKYGDNGGRTLATGKPKFQNPAVMWLHDQARHSVDGLQMRPDHSDCFFRERGLVWLNTYRPPAHTAEPAGIEVFLAFMAHLVPSKVEREWLLDRLAHKFQNPAIPGPGVLMVSKKEGTGRLTFFAMIKQLFGQAYARTIDPGQITGEGSQSQYTDWMVNSLVVTVDELISPGHTFQWQRRKIYERIKLLIDPGARSISVLRKNDPNGGGIAYASFFMATNRHNALPLEAGDRRLEVITGGERLEDNPALKEALQRFRDGSDFLPGFIAGIAAFLSTRSVAHFDPYAAPPMFPGKEIMIDAAITDATETARQVLAELPGDYITRNDFLKRVELAMARHDTGFHRTASMVEEARDVLDAGWVFMGTQRYNEKDSKAAIWVRNQRAAKKWLDTPPSGRVLLLKPNSDPTLKATEAQQRATAQGLALVPQDTNEEGAPE